MSIVSCDHGFGNRMPYKDDDRLAALEARLAAMSVALSELVEVVDRRVPGTKEELVEALQVNETGAGALHEHPAGPEDLRRMRESLWLSWKK
jgi:hypothetical protein